MTFLLTFNAGSSNVKIGVYNMESLACVEHHRAETTQEALRWVDAQNLIPKVIGHRVVHGGRSFTEPVRVTENVMQSLEALIPLAPLHQPYNLEAIRSFARRWPAVPQIACFDTAFHAGHGALEQRLPLPASYAAEGMQRFGFHGLSYAYIASILPDYFGAKEHRRVIVAHLGGGASMCALLEGKSIATTMGFSTLDGLMMGSRCGAIDPGILLYLLQHKRMPVSELETLLYENSGLKGVSGLSGDMRELEAAGTPAAEEAIALFCYTAAKQLGGLLPVLGGMDALVFTGGIGEHSARVRAAICEYFSWLGLSLEPERNRENANRISAYDSAMPVYVIPTDEEKIIARACVKLV